MAKPDYNFKAQTLKAGWDKLVRKADLYGYKYCCFGENVAMQLPTEYRSAFELVNLYYNAKEFKAEHSFIDEARKINHASRCRSKRLESRILDLLKSGGGLFLTLTFTDDILNSTTESTRRKYIINYLKSLNGRYVANIDYGKKNDREHYHAVIECKRLTKDQLNEWNNKCGNIDVKPIYYSETSLGTKDYSMSSTRISKYITKLTNHAIKETTKRNAVIYSR